MDFEGLEYRMVIKHHKAPKVVSYVFAEQETDLLFAECLMDAHLAVAKQFISQKPFMFYAGVSPDWEKRGKFTHNAALVTPDVLPVKLSAILVNSQFWTWCFGAENLEDSIAKLGTALVSPVKTFSEWDAQFGFHVFEAKPPLPRWKSPVEVERGGMPTAEAAQQNTAEAVV